MFRHTLILQQTGGIEIIMEQIDKRMKMIMLLCALPLAFACCALSSMGTVSAQDTRYAYPGGYGWWKTSPYTQEDYDLAVSFCTDGYQDKSVEEFDRSVMDWTDEAAFHKTEDALIRLFDSLSREDKNAGFILGTLSNTWDACRKKHYDTCDRQKAIVYHGESIYETYGDVYGDQVLLTSACASFQFDYMITDGASITVGERDAMLKGVENELSKYMNGLNREKLQNEDTMEKALKAELEKQLKSFGDG